MAWRGMFTGRAALAVVAAVVLGACGLEGDPPQWDANVGNQSTEQSDTRIITRPLIDPTDSEGRICTDKAPVVGTAQPESTVVAQGPGGKATAQAGSDGRFCVAVPLVKGQQNRIEVYSVHPEFGTSETEVVSLTRAGLECPGAAAAPAAQDAQTQDQAPEEQLARIVQVQTSVPPEEGSDHAMVDGDPNTYVRYSAWDWKMWQYRSDEMWIWFTLSALQQIKAIRIHWRDRAGYGNMYAEKFYVGVSPAESPGTPPAPPTSSVFSTDVAPAETQWEWISRYASMNSGGGLQEVDLGSKLPAAQHVALWLEADADDASLAENFAISEVEIILYAPSRSDATSVTSEGTSVCGVY